MIQKAAHAFSEPQKPRQRVVLDTNVCLDLFMFRDPRWQVLLDALVRGEVEAVSRADCRREFELVLAYDKMKLSAETQQALLAEFDQLIALTEPNPALAVEAEMAAPALPVCKDGDDQKFLEVALASGADVLITKDKALLKLARKTLRNGQFRILSPEGWLSWRLTGPASSQPGIGP